MSINKVTKYIALGSLGVSIVIAAVAAGQIFEQLEAGTYHVKQDYISGNLSVINDPGVYLQMFAKIHEYPVADTYDFSTPENAITVRFNDASVAKIHGQIKYTLPSHPDAQLQLHQQTRSYEAVKKSLIRQVVDASLRQSATHFGAEDVYSIRRGDFIDLTRDQIKDGIYATTFSEFKENDVDGNSRIVRQVSIKDDEAGNPIITEPSVFKTYQMGIIQLTIQDIDFDERTDELIAKRKEAEQQEIVAKADAKRAKQDAIKAREEGKAKIATVEAAALAEKATAVINAEREKEVAEQEAMKALEDEKKIKAIGRAESEAARMKVAAGLSPLEKAQIDKETAIGVAAELAKIKLPQTMVLGGNGQQSPLNPFDAVGLQSFMNITKDISKRVE
jgi:regulator of protease activity HflC (stomatin/prohibitin superfamily)